VRGADACAPRRGPVELASGAACAGAGRGLEHVPALSNMPMILQLEQCEARRVDSKLALALPGLT